MKRYLFFVIFVFQTAVSFAIPAKSVWRTVIQKDGSSIRVKLTGDEHFHYYVTEDNVPLVERGGSFYYASVRNGRLVSTGVTAHDANSRSVAERQVKTDMEQLRSLHADILRNRVIEKIPLRNRKVYAGEKRGLVILAEFPNCRFSMADPKSAYGDILNKPGYKHEIKSGIYAQGSVHDYFFDQSYGKFNLTFDVVGPVMLKHNVEYYGKDGEDGNDTNVSDMIAEACVAASKETGFDDYDWDGDGEVDQVFVLYAGYGQATPPNMSETVWPHEYQLKYTKPDLTLRGKKINTYACGNEKFEYTSGEGSSTRKQDLLMGIGVICHEFSHCLGFPDFYDVNYGDNFGMGHWDIMSSGSYNGPLEYGWVPAPYTSYERREAGWLDYTVLGNEQVSVENMKPLSDSPMAYVVYNQAWKNEYFLFENKGRTKWDEYLPKNGLLALHVDYDSWIWSMNHVNTTSGGNSHNTHQRFTVVPADNSLVMKTAENPGNEFRDTYPLGKSDSLTSTSTPALKLYNRNLDKSKYLNCKILNIRRDKSGNISFLYLPDPQLSAGTEKLVVERSAEVVAVYSIEGIRMPAADLGELSPGVYVVRYSDGRTRKVLNK